MADILCARRLLTGEKPIIADDLTGRGERWRRLLRHDGEHGDFGLTLRLLAYLANARIAVSSPSRVSGYIRSSTSSRNIPTEAE